MQSEACREDGIEVFHRERERLEQLIKSLVIICASTKCCSAVGEKIKAKQGDLAQENNVTTCKHII